MTNLNALDMKETRNKPDKNKGKCQNDIFKDIPSKTLVHLNVAMNKRCSWWVILMIW